MAKTTIRGFPPPGEAAAVVVVTCRRVRRHCMQIMLGSGEAVRSPAVNIFAIYLAVVVDSAPDPSDAQSAGCVKLQSGLNHFCDCEWW